MKRRHNIVRPAITQTALPPNASVVAAGASTAVTSSPARIAIARKPTSLSRIEAASRPVGTEASTRSSTSSAGARPATPWCARASRRIRSLRRTVDQRLDRRAGHAQAQLGDSEQACETGPHHVDGLNLREREPERLPPQQAGLDPEIVAVDPPARHEPADEADHEQQPDDRELRPVLPEVAAAGGGGERQDRDCDRSTTGADDRRHRREPVPAVGSGHNPAA